MSLGSNPSELHFKKRKREKLRKDIKNGRKEGSGRALKADRKYEVLAMLAYGFLVVRSQLQSTQHIRSCWRLDGQGKIRVGLWLCLNGC